MVVKKKQLTFQSRSCSPSQVVTPKTTNIAGCCKTAHSSIQDMPQIHYC